ncbi:hypothetical protein ACQ86N_13380 [Puia sp. P3]|uniref:hypothetical protein n=1 Tax=Puia sp. P3 TaxID=3423952 RepID=UPI003D67F87B
MQKIISSMRYLPVVFSVVIIAAAACNGGANQTAVKAALADTARFTTIQWLDSTKDYGKVPEGQQLDVAFRFRNTGTTPLVIGR